MVYNLDHIIEYSASVKKQDAMSGPELDNSRIEETTELRERTGISRVGKLGIAIAAAAGLMVGSGLLVNDTVESGKNDTSDGCPVHWLNFPNPYAVVVINTLGQFTYESGEVMCGYLPPQDAIGLWYSTSVPGQPTATTVHRPKTPKPIVTTTTINNDVDGDGFLANTDNPSLKDIDDNSAGAGIAGVAVAEAMGINVDPATEQGSLDIQIALSTAQDRWAEMTTSFAAYGVEVMTPTTTTTTTEQQLVTTVESEQTSEQSTTSSSIEQSSTSLLQGQPENGLKSSDDILIGVTGLFAAGSLLAIGLARRRQQSKS